MLFADARSQASCTFPSVNSILTSRCPTAFLGQPDEAMGIPARIPSLAEILRARGYRTVAVSASADGAQHPEPLQPGGGLRPRLRGVRRGLRLAGRPPASTASAARRSASIRRPEDDRPLFLYLHYLDPHGPYRRRPATAAGSPPAAPATATSSAAATPTRSADFLYKGAPDPGVDAGRAAATWSTSTTRRSPTSTPSSARLLRRLERRGWLDDSIVVFASDHGEEFLEHGHIKHCRTVFDTSIRTPLLLRVPGARPARFAARAQNLDVVPTVLDYLGIAGARRAASRAGACGRRSRAGGAGNAHQFSAPGPLRSAADGRFKLIGDLAAARRSGSTTSPRTPASGATCCARPSPASAPRWRACARPCAPSSRRRTARAGACAPGRRPRSACAPWAIWSDGWSVGARCPPAVLPRKTDGR